MDLNCTGVSFIIDNELHQPVRYVQAGNTISRDAMPPSLSRQKKKINKLHKQEENKQHSDGLLKGKQQLFRRAAPCVCSPAAGDRKRHAVTICQRERNQKKERGLHGGDGTCVSEALITVTV